MESSVIAVGMWVVTRRSYCAGSIAAIMMHAVMALLANHYTVVNRGKPGVLRFPGHSALIWNDMVTVFNKVV